MQNIFYHGNKRKWIPLGQLDKFFSSVAVLMTNQLRELALDSIEDYKRVFCPPQVRDSQTVQSVLVGTCVGRDSPECVGRTSPECVGRTSSECVGRTSPECVGRTSSECVGRVHS